MMTKLMVSRWDKWQSYRKDRGTPPWIKIYRSIMTNPDWSVLSDAEKGQLISLWIVAADKGGELPDDANILRKISMLDDCPDIDKLIKLGFLERVEEEVVVMLASSGCHDDAPETETETETETEDKPKRSVAFPYEEIRKHWNTTRLKNVRSLSDSRKKSLKARTNEITSAYPDFKDKSYIEIWTKFINFMSESDFLSGNTDGTFEADIDWIINPNNFAKILDGKYENREVK